MKEKGREKKKEREKRKRKEKKDELSSRSSLSVTTPRYIPHFRGQETGPAITHSCICHELNLVIGYIHSPISFLEQQVSLMNDYRGGGGRGGECLERGLRKRNNGSARRALIPTPRTILAPRVYPRGGSKS